MNIVETEVAPGIISSMRVTLKVAREAGRVMIYSGIALAAMVVALDRGYELVPFLMVLESAGPTMITGLSFAKAIQAKSEVEAERKEGGQ